MIIELDKTFFTAMENLVGDAAWNLHGNNLENIEWSDEVTVPPAVSEIIAEMESVKLGLPWETLRNQRNLLLAACDWTQLPDAPVDAVVWADYRQQLRDLPQNTIDPNNPVWPTEPS